MKIILKSKWLKGEDEVQILVKIIMWQGEVVRFDWGGEHSTIVVNDDVVGGVMVEICAVYSPGHARGSIRSHRSQK